MLRPRRGLDPSPCLERRETLTDHKRCTQCGDSKPLDDFYRNAASPVGRHTKCKACVQARQAEYRAENATRIQTRRAADRDKEREQYQRWVARNPSYFADYYQRNKTRKNENSRRWVQENLEAHRLKGLRRRARLNGPFDAAAANEYSGIISHDPCVYCGAPSAEIDHIIPVSRGGTGAWDNLAPTCVSCNRRKSTRSVLEMLLRVQTA